MDQNLSINKGNMCHSSKWIADIGNGYFRNPILYGDYSDPDVIKVGSDFYMIASTFTYFPGIPLLHSKDLVNWKVVNYVVDEMPFEYYDMPQHGKGIWAPSLRYHANKLWVYFGAPDDGVFMTTAADPLGKWEPLTMVKEVKGWIDPCPFWDEDGQAYLVHAFANSRCGIRDILYLHRMSEDGTRILDEGKLVFGGSKNHPYIEGPKMYKRNGYYYIFAPAGSVTTGWQTVLTSRNIYGPYEDKIVLHQGNTEINGPHQGGWVELDNGESWFIHFQDCFAYGRITHLQPVKWVDDWPLMGDDTNGDGIGEPVYVCKKPDMGSEYSLVSPETSDDFDSTALGLQWQWQANPKDEWYSLTANPGSLRLYSRNIASEEEKVIHNASNFLSQLFQAFEFTATVKLKLSSQNPSDRAGLAVMGNSYSYIAFSKTETGYKVFQVLGENSNKSMIEQEIEAIAVEKDEIYLRVEVKQGPCCSFSFSLDDLNFKTIGEAFTAEKGGWVGAKLGLFCTDFSGEKSSGYADIDWIKVIKD